MVSSEAVLDALGNPMRRQIVRVLHGGPIAVGAIAAQLPVSRPAVSQHLKVLVDAELVAFEEVGTRNLYRLDPKGFAAARAWLDGLWTEALENFAALATATWENEDD